MHPALAHRDHRPWKMPERPWQWRQTWQHLLFAHWPVPAAVLRPLVPGALEIEEREGTAWLGIVPFEMAGVARRPGPPIPGAAQFPELNVRTYVSYRDRPGVWFFSLDAASRLAVWGARTLFHLPYFYARMQINIEDGSVEYVSRRVAAAAEFVAEYRPTGAAELARPGSLEHWLTERYCMYAADRRGRLYRGEVHHQPWPLQSVEAEVQINTMPAAAGIVGVSGPPALLHFSRRLDVVLWSLERVATT